MGCRAQPVRYPISRTVQQMTRETRMGQPSYTEFRILPSFRVFARCLVKLRVAQPTIGEGPKRVEPLHEDLFDDAEHFLVSAMEQLSLRQPIERLADVISKTSA